MYQRFDGMAVKSETNVRNGLDIKTKRFRLNFWWETKKKEHINI